MKGSVKKRVAWFSPLAGENGDPAAVSPYTTRLLLPYLTREFDLTLCTDRVPESSPCRTIHFLDAFRAHREHPFDIFFYQLENHISARLFRQALGLEPGIVWFHHAMLSDHGPEPILNSPFTDIVRRFSDPVDCPWPKRGKEYPQGDLFAERECALALVQLFSQERDLTVAKSRTVRGLASDSNSNLPRQIWLPLPVERELFSLKPLAAKSTGHLAIAFIGSPQIENRAHKILEALAGLSFDEWSFSWVVSKSEQAAAEELVWLAGLSDRVRFVSPYNTNSWRAELGRCDLAIHMAFSGYSNLSPYIEMSLAAAKPVLTLQHGASEFLPEEIAFQVVPGATEAQQIKLVIEEIHKDSGLRFNKIGQDFAREHFSVDVIAAELAQSFHYYVDEYLPPLRDRWEWLLRDAKRELLRELDNRTRSDVFDAILKTKLIQPVFNELGWNE